MTAMTNETSQSYADKMRKHLPKEAYREIKLKLDTASDETCIRIKELKLKNTYVTLILSILFGIFGVDRLYVGDIKLGIGKMALGIVGYLFGGFGTVGFAVQLLSYVWWIEDIFFSYRLGRRKNAERIYEILNNK